MIIRLSFFYEKKCLPKFSKVISEVYDSCFISVNKRDFWKVKNVLMILAYIHTHSNYQIILFITTGTFILTIDIGFK